MELRYADNFLMRLMEDANSIDASKYSYPTSNVVLQDFFIQHVTTTGGELPVNGGGQRVFSGGFSN